MWWICFQLLWEWRIFRSICFEERCFFIYLLGFNVLLSCFTSTFFFRIRQKCNLGSRNFRLQIAQCKLAYCYACWFVRLSFSSKIEIKPKQIDLRLMCSFSILFLASRTFICICPRLNALVLHSTREAKRSSFSSIIKCTWEKNCHVFRACTKCHFMFHLVICGWKKKYFSVQGWFVKKETAGKSTQLPPGKGSLIE